MPLLGALALNPSSAHAQQFLNNGPLPGYGASGYPLGNSSLVPTLSLYNGQTASMQYQSFAFAPVNVQVVQSGGYLAFVPQYQPIPFGLNLPVQAAFGPGGSGRLNMAPTYSSIGQGPPYPVTTFITPQFAGGAQGAAVPFTQYLPQPSLGGVSLQTSVGVPFGGYGGSLGGGFWGRSEAGMLLPMFGNVQAGGGAQFGGFRPPQVNVFQFP